MTSSWPKRSGKPTAPRTAFQIFALVPRLSSLVGAWGSVACANAGLNLRLITTAPTGPPGFFAVQRRSRSISTRAGTGLFLLRHGLATTRKTPPRLSPKKIPAGERASVHAAGSLAPNPVPFNGRWHGFVGRELHAPRKRCRRSVTILASAVQSNRRQGRVFGPSICLRPRSLMCLVIITLLPPAAESHLPQKCRRRLLERPCGTCRVRREAFRLWRGRETPSDTPLRAGRPAACSCGCRC